MKKLILILFIFICNNTFSQDLIVTNNNDSINCKIIERKGSFIIYKIKIGDEFQTRSVKEEFVLNTAPQFYVINPSLVKQEKVALNTDFKNEFYLTFEINRSSLNEFAKNTGDAKIDAINDNLSSAISFSPIIEIWLSKKIGIGLKYEYYKSTAQDDNFPLYYGSFPVYYRLNEEITIHTLSPKLNFRTPIQKDKSYLVFSAMYNYNFYNDILLFTDKNYPSQITAELSTKKSGFGFSAGFEYHTLENIKIGFITGYSFCLLDEIYLNATQIQLTAANKINLNRINLGLFIGFH